MKSPKYWRQTKEWSRWEGKKGVVIGATQIRIAPPDQSEFAPYSYVIVDFGVEKAEFMGAGHEAFVIGDKVLCVLKKIGLNDPKGIIMYGIKVEKYYD